MTVYHVTPRRNLGSIMRWGLIPRDPTRVSSTHRGWGKLNEGVHAVYAARTLNLAVVFSDEMAYHYEHARVAVLELDVTGLPLEPDAYNPQVWSRVLARVEPGRIGRAG